MKRMDAAIDPKQWEKSVIWCYVNVLMTCQGTEREEEEAHTCPMHVVFSVRWLLS